LQVRNEVVALLRLKGSPHVIDLIEVIEDPDYVYLVLESMPGGDVFEYVKQKGALAVLVFLPSYPCVASDTILC
jgi:serine/threonine protein kinase